MAIRERSRSIDEQGKRVTSPLDGPETQALIPDITPALPAAVLSDEQNAGADLLDPLQE